MGLLDKIKGEFIDIVEWPGDDGQTLVWRFPRYQNEIKNGAKLTVREGQIAVFINEGQMADVFTPGIYSLTTKNLPILSTLRGWKYGFDSPFKAEVYFVSSRRFVDQKWGTRNPVMLQDPELGAVRIRAYGTYVLQLSDVKKLIREMVGPNAHFSVETLSEQIRNIIVSRFSDRISSSNIPIVEISAHFDELALSIQNTIEQEILEYGLNCSQLLIENISLPDEVLQALDRKSGMRLVGEGDYMRYQLATSAEIASGNSGSEASGGIGLGMGFGMAQQMTQSVFASPQQAAPSAATPPNIPETNASVWWIANNQKKEGPYSHEQMIEFFHSGKLNESSLVWKPGMESWNRLKDIPEMNSFIPPELPPTPKA